jgi:hypothetical protein
MEGASRRGREASDVGHSLGLQSGCRTMQTIAPTLPGCNPPRRHSETKVQRRACAAIRIMESVDD